MYEELLRRPAFSLLPWIGLGRLGIKILLSVATTAMPALIMTRNSSHNHHFKTDDILANFVYLCLGALILSTCLSVFARPCLAL